MSENSGQRAPQNAATQSQQMDPIEGATVDTGRQIRCGFGEVIYGEGKDAELIARIALSLLEVQKEVLVTRLAAADAESLVGRFEHTRYRPAARTLRIGRQPIEDPPLRPGRTAGTVAVVTAGSTDRPAAEEARETLAWMGIPVDWIEDIGVAGPQRLQAALPRLADCRAIVVAAGMEGALPSVVAGYVRCPVVALPTSVGYGAALGGLTAMMSMLTSCAAGVAVVNIDAGFKAGYLAGMIACGKEATRSET